MRPEWSIIILTSLCGVAEGMVAFMLYGDIRALTMGPSVALEPKSMIVGAAVAATLASMGAFASFFHLHHKGRFVKAFFQWRFSWLSREALLLPPFIGLTVLYGAAWMFQVNIELRLVIGMFAFLNGVALGVASGMIYSTVRYVGEWGSAYTPVTFVLNGMAAGSVMVAAALEVTSAHPLVTLSVLRVSLGAVFLALIVKAMSFRRNDTLYVSTDTASAIGAHKKEVNLIDMGSSYAHYNTKEYCDTESRRKAGTVRAMVYLFHYVFPFAILIIDYVPLFKYGQGQYAPIAAALIVVGGLMERWLFFADGNHVQNLYYGLFPSRQAPNPILQPGKTTGPLPPR